MSTEPATPDVKAATRAVTEALQELKHLQGHLEQLLASVGPNRPAEASANANWTAAHAKVLEVKSSINALYKYASAADREANVQTHRKDKKERRAERDATNKTKADSEPDEPSDPQEP